METLNLLFETTVYSGIIFTATMLLKACFKNKMSPLLHYAIWFMLVLRLMMPFTIASPVRLFVIPAEPQPIAEAVQNAYQPVAASDTDITDAADTQPLTEAVNPVHNETPTTPENAGQPLKLTLPQIVSFAWFAGTLVCMSYLAVLYASLRRKLRRNAAAPSKKLLELFNEARAEMGIKADIKLVCQYEYGTPSLMFPRTIMMPMDALVAMNDEQIKFALRHELSHYRRGDHIVSILLSLLNAFYWFNPFVWAAFGRMRKDMETACDGAVVKNLSAAARSRYASLILNLSARPSHRQLVLGLSRPGLRKAAEQRVKGIYMKGESRMSTKLITILLAAVLAITCFTTACQPVTEEPERNNPVSYAGNNPDTAILLAPKPPKSYKIQEHWSDTAENEKVKILIDADVFVPNETKYPIVKLERAELSQQRVDELVNYFAKGKDLYLPCFTKADYATWIENAREGNDSSNDYYLKQLEEMQAAAPEDLQAIYTDTTLKPVKYINGEILMENGLWVMIGNGDADDGSISLEASPASFSYSAYARFGKIVDLKYLNGERFDKNKVEITQDEAVAQAEKVMSDLGITDLMLVNAEISEVPGSPDKGGYKLEYARESGGIPLYWFMSGGRFGNEAPPPYTSPFTEEKLTAFITKDGLATLYWTGCTHIVETVSDNAELMPFDKIRQALKDRIFYKSSFLREGMYQDFTVTVISAELRMGYIGVEDNSNQALMVPVWVFRTQETYTENNRTYPGNEEIYMLNAIDGGAMELEW